MSNTQNITHDYVKPIINTGNIIAMLNRAGFENDKATEIAQEIDVQINAVLDDKLSSEDVTKIVDERLHDVATKEFVRAEIQEVKAEVQEFKTEVKAEFKVVRSEMQANKSELQKEIQTIRTDLQKGLRQNLISTIVVISVLLGAFYFLLKYNI